MPGPGNTVTLLMVQAAFPNASVPARRTPGEHPLVTLLISYRTISLPR